MSESIVFHTRVRIKDGEFEQFLDAAKRFVDVVEEEPGALKCGCYVDREARTVVFVESFTDLDAFLAHWEFPGIKAIQPEMVPRVEEFERMEVYGHVPEEILAGFASRALR
jgi:quinol monooxygenase YgiN